MKICYGYENKKKNEEVMKELIYHYMHLWNLYTIEDYFLDY
jgi:hypothetical protein